MPHASIVIVTRNRKEMARAAVESALDQEGDHEVIVIDDGSTDGTAEYLREHCPRATVHRVEQQLGYIVHRSRSAELASAAFLVSIDDDAVFLHPDSVNRTLRLFEGDDRVAAVAMPFVNRGEDGADHLMLTPVDEDGRVHLTHTFVGTAYALRRDVFQRLGGFNNYLFHWGEESEYCQRLIAAGYLVRIGTRVEIRHSPGWAGKYTRKVHRYVYRNRLLLTWLNAPTVYLLPTLAVQTAWCLKQFVKGASDRVAALQGLALGYASMVGGWRLRKGISTRAFRLWLFLRKHPGVDLRDLNPALQPAAAPTPPG